MARYQATRRRASRRRRPIGRELHVALPWLALALIAALPASLGISILTDEAERQRHDFLVAEAALARGERDSVQDLVAGLSDYPLFPYLRYAELAADLEAANPEAVAAFLETYPETPLADRLRSAWLDRLARQGRWSDYLTLYRPGGPTAERCHYLHALIATELGTEALDAVEPLWLVGRSQPAACDPVFTAWRAAARLTPSLVWQRIELAMAAGRRRLAAYLGRFLPEAPATDREWLARWLAVDADPTLIEDPDSFPTDHAERDEVIAHGLVRLAAEDPERAATAWETWQSRFAPTAAQAAAVEAALGLALAQRGDERALDYLDRVPADGANQAFQERRLRIALAHEDWPRVADWIERMPPGERKTERWLYWQARAADALGQTETARHFYRQAAEVRGFWGFLAAERIGAPYNLTHQPTEAPDRLRDLVADPALRRIEELSALGREADLRREWTHLIADLDADGLQAAALVATVLDWPDIAIRTLARSGRWDDLALRFPTPHRDLVQAEATATGLPESWIYAIIRQESLFRPSAGSRAGAVGLMQLMPATARWIAPQLGHSTPTRPELLEPATNIALGAGYLAHVRDRFDGDPVLATAAYNAGPGRVRRWRPTRPEAADLWIATIPFDETRDYVERVLAYRLIYAARLGLDDGPLGRWLAPLGGTDEETPAGDQAPTSSTALLDSSPP
ncbi:soluble lytic murein transglycosylase-like protein [Thioflavicoccus mobilis 8321]|uniref:Soluble lytic murein transglycosylase-like protein n=1 Tax=Thioflavicoccus mobilis 8321 TaxID=765912 RepID=L0GZL0_9GAMM|nr:transglycosylase SLT domain-containing protein [Thioflavicoccus mobilis]AGA91406.1 soluble lytic murein transglycosylase-like protein [Thioflavicoccus mobilis 8321]